MEWLLVLLGLMTLTEVVWFHAAVVVSLYQSCCLFGFGCLKYRFSDYGSLLVRLVVVTWISKIWLVAFLGCQWWRLAMLSSLSGLVWKPKNICSFVKICNGLLFLTCWNHPPIWVYTSVVHVNLVVFSIFNRQFSDAPYLFRNFENDLSFELSVHTDFYENKDKKIIIISIHSFGGSFHIFSCVFSLCNTKKIISPSNNQPIRL